MQPNAIYLEFDLGSNANAHRELMKLLAGLGATARDRVLLPEHRYVVSVPIQLKEELADYGLATIRLVDELHVEPCAVSLKRVIGRVGPDGTVRTARAAEAAPWAAVSTGYQATCPNRTELHHIVTIEKNGAEPPITIEGWTISEDAKQWQYQSTKSLNGNGDLAAIYRREIAKVTSLFKSAAHDIEFTMRAEQVLVCWNDPFEVTKDNDDRVSVKRWAGVSERSLPDLPKIYTRDSAARDEILRDLQPFRTIALKQGLQPLVLGLAIVPVHGSLDALVFGNSLCTEGGAYGATKQEAEDLLKLFGTAMWTLAHSPSSPLRSWGRGFDRLEVWSMVLPQSKPPSKNGASRRNNASKEEVVIASAQRFSITPGRQMKRIHDVVLDALAEIHLGHHHLHHTGIFAVPFRTALNADRSFYGGCFFGMLSASRLTKLQLDEVGHRISNLLLRRALNWPEAAGASPLEAASAAKAADKKQLSLYAQGRAELAGDHDKVWDVLVPLSREPADVRVKKLTTDFPQVLALAQKYPNLINIKKDLEANAGLTALVHSACLLMGGGSMRSMYRWRELAGLPKRRDD